MRVLLIELRRTWLLWTVVPVTALSLWMVLSRADEWQGSWIAATTYATAPVGYAVMALCTVIGAESAHRRRTGLWSYVRCSPRSPFRAVGVHVAALLLLALVPVVVVFTAVWVVNRSTAPAGFFDTGYAAYALLFLAIAVTIADLVGLLTSSTFAGAVLGAAVGVVSGFFAEIPLTMAPELRMSPARIGLAAALMLAAVVSVLLIPVLWASARRPLVSRAWAAVAGVVVVVALALTVGGADVAGATQVDRPAPARARCSDGAPRVCVWPDHAAYLGELERMARVAGRIGTGVLPVPDSFDEFGLAGNRDGTYTFKVVALGPGLWWTAGGMADTLLNSAVVPAYCEPATDEDNARKTELITDLEYWLQSRIYGSGQPPEMRGYRPDTTRVDPVLRTSEAEQKSWAKQTLAEILATPCAPESADS